MMLQTVHGQYYEASTASYSSLDNEAIEPQSTSIAGLSMMSGFEESRISFFCTCFEKSSSEKRSALSYFASHIVQKMM